MKVEDKALFRMWRGRIEEWNPNIIRGIYKVLNGLKWLEPILGLGHLI